MHDAYIGGRSENNNNNNNNNTSIYKAHNISIRAESEASCMTISGGRTKQLNIVCHVTGFTSDFLSFIVVERIRFFHGALHFRTNKPVVPVRLCTLLVG